MRYNDCVLYVYVHTYVQAIRNFVQVSRKCPIVYMVKLLLCGVRNLHTNSFM